jgi:hypothetical protein
LSNTLVGCYCLVARRDTDGSPVLGVFLLVCFVLSQANEGATMFKRMHRTPNAEDHKQGPKRMDVSPHQNGNARRTASPRTPQINGYATTSSSHAARGKARSGGCSTEHDDHCIVEQPMNPSDCCLLRHASGGAGPIAKKMAKLIALYEERGRKSPLT